jgi:glycosyltransferase involved in cell wall biosynthesis
MNSTPMVSIVMITYGHENYIGQAIEGVLMQECNFEIELIIANDCSPDKTDDVVKEIINNHQKSSLIKYIKHKKNIGMMPNFIFALKKAQGKYIALCEGDDYWTDPLKLQKQVDFLEKNKNYSLIASNAHTNLKDEMLMYNTRKEGDFYCKDILISNFIPTASIVFNREDLFFPEFFSDSPAGDWLLMTYLLINKKGYYISEPLVFYRVHEGGIWSSLKLKNDINTKIKNANMFFSNYNIFLKMKQDPLFNKEELKIIEKKRNSNGYQYNRLLLINSEIKENLKRIPLYKFNLATIIKLLILKLKGNTIK